MLHVITMGLIEVTIVDSLASTPALKCAAVKLNLEPLVSCFTCAMCADDRARQ